MWGIYLSGGGGNCPVPCGTYHDISVYLGTKYLAVPSSNP